MTHNDIYTKFMIEYDKENVTSSYPSLTKYEVATILDKAYYALIALKVTGNNPRHVPFEADVKSISDVQPLVINQELSISTTDINEAKITIPTEFLYFVQLLLKYNCTKSETVSTTPLGQQQEDVELEVLGYDDIDFLDQAVSTADDNDSFEIEMISPISQGTSVTQVATAQDGYGVRCVPVKLTSHDVAEKFIVTPYNLPWVKIPVAFMESRKICIVYDPINKPDLHSKASLTFIKKPASFVDNVNNTGKLFELSDSMAEELISLAVMLALENVESTRLNTKVNMRGLES